MRRPRTGDTRERGTPAGGAEAPGASANHALHATDEKEAVKIDKIPTCRVTSAVCENLSPHISFSDSIPASRTLNRCLAASRLFSFDFDFEKGALFGAHSRRGLLGPDVPTPSTHTCWDVYGTPDASVREGVKRKRYSFTQPSSASVNFPRLSLKQPAASALVQPTKAVIDRQKLFVQRDQLILRSFRCCKRLSLHCSSQPLCRAWEAIECIESFEVV